MINNKHCIDCQRIEISDLDKELNNIHKWQKIVWNKYSRTEKKRDYQPTINKVWKLII